MATSPHQGLRPVVVAVDCGTQSVRVAAFDRAGARVALARQALTAMGTSAALLERVNACARALTAKLDSSKHRVVALSITGQRATTIPVVANPGDDTPILSWTEARPASRRPTPPVWLRAWTRMTGRDALLNALQRRAPINRLWADQFPVWRDVRQFHTVQGWLARQWTGEVTDADAAQAGFWPFNHRRRRWQPPGHWQWRALAVRRSQLPSLVRPGMRLGSLTPTAANATGLPAGVPVIAAGSDKGCEVLAASGDDRMVISLGSAATVTRPLPAFQYVQPLRPAYAASDGASWDAEMQLDAGFRSVTAFIENEQRRDPALSLRLEQLDGALSERRPRDDDLVYLPFSARNLTFPGHRETGGWTDPRRAAEATVEARYGAVVEGILMALRFASGRLDARFPGRDGRLITGGGSGSAPVAEMAAAVFGTSVEVPSDRESSLRGAALTAAVGCGWFADFRAARSRFNVAVQRVAPGAAAAVYERRYRRIYEPLLAMTPQKRAG